MALLMEAGSEPKTESEIADLVAINALKETAALELKVPSPLSPQATRFDQFTLRNWKFIIFQFIELSCLLIYINAGLVSGGL